MAKYSVYSGLIDAPVKVVLYGPEGIGKSTFAANFPDPVFIDTEGGTKRLKVRRLPAPASWAMLIDEVAEVTHGGVPCSTLVVDTADWAERLCIQAVCDKYKVKGIEDFGYGKGYTYTKEEFGKLLDALEEVIDSGKNVVITAHANITRFEQPDAMGSYDRWQMKTSRQVAPLLREWGDMLLFANYKTVVEKSGTGPNAKNKASGGKRVLYTTHNPCWDAKNRFDLPDELPLDYAAIAHCIEKTASPAGELSQIGTTPNTATATPAAKTPAPAGSSSQIGTSSPTAKKTAPVPERPIMVDDAPPPTKKQAARADAKTEAEYKARLDDQLYQAGVPAALRQLMVANKVEEADVRHAVAQKGYFPEDMPIRDYPQDFVDGCLVAAWPTVYEMVKDFSDVPF